MRAKDLNLVKVIDCVAQKKSCTKSEIMEYFGIKKIERNKYDDKYAPFGYRTLWRYLDELVEEGILCLQSNYSLQSGKTDYYSISPDLISTELIEKTDFSQMLLMLMECGEINVSKTIQNYLNAQSEDISMDIVEHYIRTVHENVDNRDYEDIVGKINEAIAKKQNISFDYAGQKKHITPICLLLNRNGTQMYLYGVRKGKLAAPFLIEKIHFITVERQIEFAEYQDKIEGWAMDNQAQIVSEEDIWKQYIEDKIKENVKVIVDTKEHGEISITDQNNKKSYGVPVAYLLQKKESKKKKYYVCCVGRNQAINCYDLSQVKIKRREIDREHIIECIEEAWDVDVEEPRFVRLHVIKGNDDSEIVEEELRKKLRSVAGNMENEVIYEGEIRGINNFKSWIREHMITCIVEEPKEIRDELYIALQEKLRRYEEIEDE